MFRKMFKGSQGWLVIFTIKKTEGAPELNAYPFRYPEEEADALIKATSIQDRDVYFGVNLQKEKPGEGKRGDSEGVGMTFGLWQDFDIGGDGCIPDERTLVKFLELLGLPDPSVLVHSGGGWHGYWTLDVPMTDVKVIAGLEQRFQKALEVLFNNEGWKLDSVFDMARVLRVPGTTNCKKVISRPVKLLTKDGPDYLIDQLTKMVEDLEAKAATVTVIPTKAPKPAVAPASDDELANDWFELDGVKYPITERRRRYRNMLMSDNFKRSVSGAGGHKRTYHAACLRHAFALTIDEARPILEEYNEAKCDPPWTQGELEHKLEDSVKFEDERTGWLLPDGREEIKDEVKAEVEEDEYKPRIVEGTSMPPGMNGNELYEYCREHGTLLEAWIWESRKVYEGIDSLLPVLGGIMLGSQWMAPCVRIGKAAGHKSFIPWTYAILAADTTSGKGTVSRGVRRAMLKTGIVDYDEGSERNFYDSMGDNPWSAMMVSEMKDYIGDRQWKSPVMDGLKKSADGDVVSQSTKTLGKLRIENSGPSFMGEVQPDLFQSLGKANSSNDLKRDGFFPRCAIAHDSRVRPAESVIGDLTDEHEMDVEMIDKAYAWFFDWLPERMLPSGEETETFIDDAGKPQVKKLGIWKHPVSGTLLVPAKYSSVLLKHLVPKEIMGLTVRLVKHYLPIIAVFFETKENLKAGMITLQALEKADKVLLAFWYSAKNFYGCIPEEASDLLVNKVINKLKQTGEMPLGTFRKMIRGPRTQREWSDLVKLGVDLGLWTVTERKNKKTTAQYIKLAENAELLSQKAKNGWQPGQNVQALVPAIYGSIYIGGGGGGGGGDGRMNSNLDVVGTLGDLDIYIEPPIQTSNRTLNTNDQKDLNSKTGKNKHSGVPEPQKDQKPEVDDYGF